MQICRDRARRRRWRLLRMTCEQTFSCCDVPGRSVIEHGPSPPRWLPYMANRRPLAYAVLAASKGLRYDCQLDDLDVDPGHGTNAHGYGVSVSHIVIRIAGVARPVRGQRKAAGAAGSRVTISRSLVTPSRHTIFTRYEDAHARSRCPHPRGMHAVPNQPGHTSPQRTRVAAILTPWVHPDRQGGTGTAADSCDVES
jgi:hypothetical protein